MISLALMLALQAAMPAPAANSGPGPLGAIGQQKLPAKGCAAYLWSMDAGRQLVALHLVPILQPVDVTEFGFRDELHRTERLERAAER